MTRVQELQEIECLAAANLTEYDSVWPMAEGRFQEITNAHSRQAVLQLSGFKADKVVLVHPNFGRVLNKKNSLVRRNEFPKNIQEGRFSSSCAASYEDVLPSEDVRLQLIRQPSFQGSGLNEILDAEVSGVELANGQRDAIQAAGWDHGGNPASIWQA